MKSYLSIDDVNGPGSQSYKKLTPIPSCNFALYKIHQYALCDTLSERKRFVTELTSTFMELGPFSIDYIEPLLESIQAEDCIEIQIELCQRLPSIFAIISQSQKVMSIVIKSMLEIVRILALSQNFEVSRTMVENVPKIIQYLESVKVNNEIVGIALSLVLDKSREEVTMHGLALVKMLVKHIGVDLVERYFYREILEISADNSVPLNKLIIDIIAEAFALENSESIKSKFIPIYVSLCDNENWNLRKHCISHFPTILKNSTKDFQDLIVPLFCKLLKDKSKWVKELAINTCCIVIVYMKINIPEIIIKNLLNVTESGFYNASFYFASVLLTLGQSYWADLKKLLYRINESEITNKLSIIQSMHEIAKILGAENSAKELTDIYNLYLHDSALKITAYENLPNFLREIFPEMRDEYKSLVKSMARDSSDWRHRYVFVKTICEYIGVYDYNCLYAEIWPLALELCEDNNYTIRNTVSKEVAKLAMYLLSKNIDWKRHIELCIKKYSLGNINSRITFLKIVKNFMGTEFAADFTSEVEILSKDKVVNVRIMCAEAVNYIKDNVWEGARQVLLNDKEKNVREIFGKMQIFHNKGDFIVPPITRPTHQESIGGIVKFNHSSKGKMGRIEGYVMINK